MTDYTIKVEGARFNLSPTLFRLHAAEYLQCYRSYKPSISRSPVPYFLLCRAIELALKAWHLETKSRKEVKDTFGHDLSASYAALPVNAQSLDGTELGLLASASTIYKSKGLEYVQMFDVLSGFASFPDLAHLERLAAKIVAGAPP